MKKLIGFSLAGALAIAACLIPVATMTTGCGTLGGGGTNTNDQAVIDATALILKGAARDGALYAIQTDPSTKQYFALAADTLSTFVTGKDYTPGAFQSAIMSVGGPTATNVWVQIGMGTVIDLYQLYYGQYVKNAVNSNTNAVEFIVAVQDGLNQALGNPVSAKRPKVAAPAPAPSAILPRPLYRVKR